MEFDYNLNKIEDKSNSGRDMGFTYNQCIGNINELKENIANSDVELCDLCDESRGWRKNRITDKIEECPKCKGYGFIRNR